MESYVTALHDRIQQQCQNENEDVEKRIAAMRLAGKELTTAEEPQCNHDHHPQTAPATSADGDGNAEDKTFSLIHPHEVLEIIQVHQEHRIKASNSLDQAFKKLLSTGDLGTFQQLVLETTSIFAYCAEEIRLLANELEKEMKRNDLAVLVGRLQEKEKQKMHLTVQYQLAKKEVVVREALGTLSSEQTENTDSLQRQIAELVEDISDIMEEMRLETMELKQQHEAEVEALNGADAGGEGR